MWWKWLLAIVTIPLGAAAIVAGIGALLPRHHEGSAERLMPAPQERVARMVRDVEAQSRWRPAVSAIEIVERGDDRLRYVERQGGDAILFELVEAEQGARFVSTIADPNLPFGGSWTISLAAVEGGTRVRIEERGEVSNVIYRFFSALVFGHDATMRAYLDDMERALRSGG